MPREFRLEYCYDTGFIRPKLRWLIVILLLLNGCAGRLVLQSVSMKALPEPQAPRILAGETKGEPATGSASPLPAGLHLQPIGQIAQGIVFHPVGREIMVIGQDREEAFVVVQGTDWTGYYLPFEKAFLALKKPVSLPLE